MGECRPALPCPALRLSPTHAHLVSSRQTTTNNPSHDQNQNQNKFNMPTSTGTAMAVPESAKDLLATKLRESNGQPASSSAAPSPSPMLSRQTDSTSASGASSLVPSVQIKSVPLQGTEFVEPKKRIVSPASLARFEGSDTFAEILAFVGACNASVVGKTLQDQVHVSDASKAIISLLEEVARLRKDTPPDGSGPSSRFGNPAFRTFYAKLKEQNDELHRKIPGLESEGSQGARKELSVYFQESWGNEKRIDYGSGMELNFACWL